MKKHDKDICSVQGMVVTITHKDGVKVKVEGRNEPELDMDDDDE
jgi:hypothetical protein